MMMKAADEHQMTALNRRAVNAVTREIAEQGILLSHDQADALGEEVLEWMHSRLGMQVELTADGVACHAAGEEG